MRHPPAPDHFCVTCRCHFNKNQSQHKARLIVARGPRMPQDASDFVCCGNAISAICQLKEPRNENWGPRTKNPEPRNEASFPARPKCVTQKPVGGDKGNMWPGLVAVGPVPKCLRLCRRIQQKKSNTKMQATPKMAWQPCSFYLQLLCETSALMPPLKFMIFTQPDSGGNEAGSPGGPTSP